MSPFEPRSYGMSISHEIQDDVVDVFGWLNEAHDMAIRVMEAHLAGEPAPVWVYDPETKKNVEISEDLGAERLVRLCKHLNTTRERARQRASTMEDLIDDYRKAVDALREEATDGE